MASLEELRETRIKKLEALKKAGLNVYPKTVKRDYEINWVLNHFGRLRLTAKSMNLIGRIRAFRTQGGITFADLEDPSGRIQLLFGKDALGKIIYQNLLDLFDIGDFIQISGKAAKTKKGEKTIQVKSLTMIAKALRPLPEKWHGLQDIEERYRKRYLDLLMNPEIKKRFLCRSKIIKEARNYLNGNNFMEVETPILQTLPGGANAKPFGTHLNDLKLDVYLRIAPELYLKRLLVGNFEKIYELGRNFRNEGLDASHNPEFTMLEAYIAYQDSTYLKKFIRELLQDIVKEINDGNLVINYEDKKINFAGSWQEVDYNDLIKKFEKEARPEEGISAWDIAKKSLIQPTIVSGFPADLLPLAKAADHKAEAFQVIIGGWELVKAFTEQNDPLEQRTRLQEQEQLRQKGQEEAQRLDEDFLEALEYGMPPAAGFGLGIDRLAALVTNSHTLREIILFPTMKPKE